MRGAVLSLMLLGCAESKTVGDEHPQKGAHTNDADADTDADADADADADSGEPGPTPEHLMPGTFEGTLDVGFIYDGVYGHFEDGCSGSVRFTVDEAFVVDGSGDCTLGALGMGFFIEGNQDDHQVTGVLAMESATDRVETPFTGTRNADNVQLAFDTTHINEGEQVRVFGTMHGEPIE